MRHFSSREMNKFSLLAISSVPDVDQKWNTSNWLADVILEITRFGAWLVVVGMECGCRQHWRWIWEFECMYKSHFQPKRNHNMCLICEFPMEHSLFVAFILRFGFDSKYSLQSFDVDINSIVRVAWSILLFLPFRLSHYLDYYYFLARIPSPCPGETTSLNCILHSLLRQRVLVIAGDDEMYDIQLSYNAQVFLWLIFFFFYFHHYFE